MLYFIEVLKIGEAPHAGTPNTFSDEITYNTLNDK